MAGINYGRVVIGGLVAGLVINVSEAILNGLILMDDYEAMSAQYGITEASWAIAGYIISAFVLGLIVAWLYAAIRPRFGAGWKTGATAGAALWLAAYAVPGVWFGAMGMSLGGGLLILSLVWTLVEIILGGMVAGWLYQEGGAAAAPAEAAMP